MISSTSAPARSRPSRRCTAATSSGGAVAETSTGRSPSSGVAQSSACAATSVPSAAASGSIVKTGARSAHIGDLRSASPRSTTRTAPPPRPSTARQRIGAAAVAEQALAAEILRQAQRDPRAAGDQRQIGRRLADRLEIRVGDRIDDRVPDTLGAQRVEGGADRRRPSRDRGVLHEPDPPRRLALQDAHEGGVAHRRQRMVAHARFRQQHVADEQIAFEDRPAVLGKSRAEQGEVGAERVEQRLGDRADIALRRSNRMSSSI